MMGKFFEQCMYAQKHNIYIGRNLSIIDRGLAIKTTYIAIHL